MNPKFDPGDQTMLATTQQLFGPSHVFERLTSGERPAGGRIPFARLFAYVGEAENDTEVEAALKESASLRADYRRLVEKFTEEFVPLAIAADTGEENERNGIGCRLRFVPSSAEPSQTYVIVEFSDKQDVPASTLFLCDQHDDCLKLPLVATRDGKIQLLLENDSDLLARLRDKKTVIFRRS